MDTELLLEGAKKLAAGQALGLTPEQTLVLLQREIKRQQRRDPALTEGYLLNQMLKASTEASMVGDAELKDRTEVDLNRDAAAVGQMQDDFQQLNPNDRGWAGLETAANKRNREDREDVKEQRRLEARTVGGKDAQGNRVFEVPLQGYEPTARDRMVASEGEIGTAGVRDALSRLRSANQAATTWYRPGGLKGAAAVEGRLEDSLRSYSTSGSENVQRNADASLGRELVRRDSERFNPVSEAAKLNNLQAAQEANAIRREIAQGSILGGQGFKGQEVLNQIPTRQQRMNLPRVQQIAADRETKEGLYVDPITGNPVEVSEPATTAIAGANTPDTAQELNAPKQSSSISWVAKQMPQPNAFANSGGDMPQIPINVPTQLFSERLRAIKGIGPGLQGISGNVRNVQEFEKAINYVIQQGNASNIRWNRETTPEDSLERRFQRTYSPGADEVMNLMRYTPAEKRQLAGALYQLEMARGSGVENAVKEAYFARAANAPNLGDVRFDSPDAMINPNPNETTTPLARIGPKQTLEGKPIRPQLRELSNPDARNPQIGLVRGERSEIYRYAPGNLAPDGIDTYFADEEGFRARRDRKPVNIERQNMKIAEAKLAVERQARFEQQQAQAAEIEAQGMVEAKSDFNRMVKAERTNRGRRPLPGRIY